MGVLIKDTITLDSGLQVTNAYGNIGKQSFIKITKTIGSKHDPPGADPSVQYLLEGQLHIWPNQEKANEGDNKYIINSYNLVVNKLHEPFTGNMYELLYDCFKNHYGFTCENV